MADLTHPDDREPEATLVREMLDGRRDRYDLEKRFACADGRTVGVHVWVSLVRAADGAARGLIVQAVDVAGLGATRR